MAKKSLIPWCDHSFNGWWGCQNVSVGCDHCYAEAMDQRFYGGKHWSGATPRRINDRTWKEPLKWDQEAKDKGIKYTVFCESMGDIFDNNVPQEWREDIWQLIKVTPNLNWILVTKRIGNALKMLPANWGAGYPNVWLLISASTEKELKRDLRTLFVVPTVVRGLSLEPQIEEIDLYRVFQSIMDECTFEGNSTDPRHPCNLMLEGLPLLEWVITGSESDARNQAKRRPIAPYEENWARVLRDNCTEMGIAFFYKQITSNGKTLQTPELDGRTWKEFPNTFHQERGLPQYRHIAE